MLGWSWLPVCIKGEKRRFYQTCGGASVAQQVETVQGAFEVVVEAAWYQFAAPAGGVGQQFVAGQPHGADDVAVQCQVGVMAHGAGGEADALVGHAVAWGGVQVDADHAGELDFPGGFFEGFAQGGLGQGLVGFEVAGGLVEDVLVGFEFFDEEELAFVFDDGGDGDVGLPGHLYVPLNCWGRFAAHRRQASSHRGRANIEPDAVPVGAGLPAMGCKAAPVPRKHKPRCVAGVCAVTSSEPYRAAMALFRVWLGRITLAVSSASGA
ncbi:protein of unknown function [Pseudomonas sp. JV551A1]|nr:protein of unknown function [Pseudomonas sp. JV551A1]